MEKSKDYVKVLAQAALCAALCYVGATFIKIDIPVGTEKTMFHFGNTFCDLTTSYVTSAPKTFVLKLCIGLIVGLVAHKGFKLSKEHSAKYVTMATIVSSAAGMVFNIFADPIVGYFYKTYILGVPQDLSKALAKIGALTTSVNAVIAVIFASVIYLILRPVLKKSGMLREM